MLEDVFFVRECRVRVNNVGETLMHLLSTCGSSQTIGRGGAAVGGVQATSQQGAHTHAFTVPQRMGQLITLPKCAPKRFQNVWAGVGVPGCRHERMKVRGRPLDDARGRARLDIASFRSAIARQGWNGPLQSGLQSAGIE